jgi:SAM-dependent methyltransferase
VNQNQAFFDYSEIYDVLYQDKDYAGECDFLEALFSRYGRKPIHRLIDVAAGTGSHAIRMAERGYEVLASDYSSSMAEIAQRKAEQKGVRIKTQGGVSMTDLTPAGSPFDAVLCLFAAIDYLVEPFQAGAFLEAAKKLMHEDSLLIFDFWNGITCLKEYSPTRVKDVSSGSLRVVRVSETRLFPMLNQAEVRFKCFVFRGDKDRPREIDEVHRMRYYFPSEIDELLARHGFEVLGVHPFKDSSRGATETDWNLTYVARKKASVR